MQNFAKNLQILHFDATFSKDSHELSEMLHSLSDVLFEAFAENINKYNSLVEKYSKYAKKNHI